MKNEPVPINIKDVPYMLHKQFKKKCKDAGCSMTRVQIRLMEMIRDGEVVLEKSGNIRFRKEGEGQQEEMLKAINVELAEAFLSGTQEDSADYQGATAEEVMEPWKDKATEIVKKLCET